MWSLEGQLCRGDSATRRPPPPVKAVRVCSLVCGPVEKTHSITFLTDSPAELTQGTAGSHRVWRGAHRGVPASAVCVAPRARPSGINPHATTAQAARRS